MTEPYFDPALDLPVGEYQAEICGKIETETLGETIVLFRLTKPQSKNHPQYALAGRIARAWFMLDHPNKATRRNAEALLDRLLTATDATSLDKAIGKIVRIRLARVIMRSDPSRTKVAAVEFLPIEDKNVRPFVT